MIMTSVVAFAILALSSVCAVDMSAEMYNQATAYLEQAGTDACKDLADSTFKETTDSYKLAEDTLSKMDTGASCLKEGSDAIAAANQTWNKAEKAASVASNELNAAKTADVQFVPQSFSTLQPGNCDPIFESAGFKAAENKVMLATGALEEAKGKVKEALKFVAEAQEAAASAVKVCQCRTATALTTAYDTVSKGLIAANNDAWSKASALECVLGGNCVPGHESRQLRPLPTLKRPTAADGVSEDKCMTMLSKDQLYGRAEQGSQGWDGNPQRAVDGNTSGDFGVKSCTHTKDGGPRSDAWWNVDLGRNYSIQKVVVWNRSDCCRDRLDGVEVLVDSQKCGTITKQQQHNSVSCGGKTGSMITIKATSHDYLTLCEVEVWVRNTN